MEPHAILRILSIQSQVIVGYVGNKLTSFPIQVLGIDIDTMNCIQLPHHNGYNRLGTSNQHDKLVSMQWTPEIMHSFFDSIMEKQMDKSYSLLISGYLSSPKCVPGLSTRISHILNYSTPPLYILDPVLGDQNKLYVDPEMIDMYIKYLIPLAHIMTPNQFEIEQLTQVPVCDLKSAYKACQCLASLNLSKPPLVIITSLDLVGSNIADNNSDEMILFLVTPQGTAHYLKFPKFKYNFAGTGDLFVSLLAASVHLSIAKGTEFYGLPFAELIGKVIWVIQKILVRTSALYESFRDRQSDIDKDQVLLLASDLIHRELRIVDSVADILQLTSITVKELLDAGVTFHSFES